MYLCVSPSIKKKKIHIRRYMCFCHVHVRKEANDNCVCPCMHVGVLDVREKANRCRHMRAPVYVRNRLQSPYVRRSVPCILCVIAPQLSRRGSSHAAMTTGPTSHLPSISLLHAWQQHEQHNRICAANRARQARMQTTTTFTTHAPTTPCYL